MWLHAMSEIMRWPLKLNIHALVLPHSVPQSRCSRPHSLPVMLHYPPPTEYTYLHVYTWSHPPIASSRMLFSCISIKHNWSILKYFCIKLSFIFHIYSKMSYLFIFSNNNNQQVIINRLIIYFTIQKLTEITHIMENIL